jgi:hypothetical protein
MWPFSLFESSNMFAAKELKVGKRYRVPTNRSKDGLGPCSTLTRKRHLANGTRYALTFDSGTNRRWQFYNFTGFQGLPNTTTTRPHPQTMIIFSSS